MIYIQAHDNYPLLPYNHECSCAMYGAIDVGHPYTLVQFADLKEHENKFKHNPYVGTVEFMNYIWKHLHVNPRIENTPDRSYLETTLGQAKKMTGVFIKPKQLKLFTGLVLDGSHYTCLDSLSDDTEVMLYAPFKSPIASEWRFYIMDNIIEDCRNYSGDPMIFPDVKFVQHLLNMNKRFDDDISTYCIDLAILENDDQVVVEQNDMWAIGNYGVRNDIYLKMLETRYLEIIKHL